MLAKITTILLAPTLQTEPARFNLPWWVWLVILLLVIFVVWWLISRQARNSASLDERPQTHAASTSAHPVEAHPAQPPVQAGLTPPVVEPVLVAEPPPVVEAPVTAAAAFETVRAGPASLGMDDLQVIEGIGPKIKGVLQAAGITTFAGLAAADPARLLEILHAAGLRLGDPTTWPEQAALAAAGNWEDLQRLQDGLKGGRRVTPNI
jgi:predicted flap endonuclease-1-like 5' DNA nuclease